MYILPIFKGNSGSPGLIKVSAINTTSTADTALSYDSNTKHIDSWTITIYKNSFDGNADAGKYRTIAHEIGHVYGLSHFNNPNQIMYESYSVTKNVTNNDKRGMNVMTHTHTHSGTYSTTLEQYSSYSHKVRCSICLSYHLATCTSTNYHHGRRHYLDVNCACGNTTSTSWVCSGNPCTFPFVSPNPLEEY